MATGDPICPKCGNYTSLVDHTKGCPYSKPDSPTFFPPYWHDKDFQKMASFISQRIQVPVFDTPPRHGYLTTIVYEVEDQLRLILPFNLKLGTDFKVTFLDIRTENYPMRWMLILQASSF